MAVRDSNLRHPACKAAHWWYATNCYLIPSRTIRPHLLALREPCPEDERPPNCHHFRYRVTTIPTTGFHSCPYLSSPSCIATQLQDSNPANQTSNTSLM